MRYQQKPVNKMQTYLFHLVVACLLVVNCGAVDSIEPLKSASTSGSEVTSDQKDLEVSASDHAALLLSRDHGYGGLTGVGSGYGNRGGSVYSSSVGGYPGVGSGSIYGAGTTYQSSGLTPSYRGYQAGGYGNGIIGGGHTGYGYYGGSGAYDGYGGQNGYGSIGNGIYDDGYSGYSGSRVGGGYNGGYGGGYGGGNTATYNPYDYRGSGSYGGGSYRRYGGYGYQPTGYRGYS